MNIKDFPFHLYMGCDFKKGEDIKKLTPTRYFLIYDRDDWKLLLRPLSDMTEEEKGEICRLFDEDRIANSPKQFLYLLSKGFDLFGLIDAGLALNKTTCQSPQSTSTTTL